MYSFLPTIVYLPLRFGLTYVYPMMETLKILVKTSEEKPETSKIEYIQWLTFWLLILLQWFIEKLLFLPSILPFYPEIKLCLLLWLVHPNFQGAALIWQNFLETYVKKGIDVYAQHVEPKVLKYLDIFARRLSAAKDGAIKVAEGSSRENDKKSE